MLGLEHLIKYKTPFYIYRLNSIKDNYFRLKQVLPPDCSIHYAVKACSDDEVIKVLTAIGSKFEVASKTEIDTLVRNGVNMKDTVYTSPVKTIDGIQRAIAVGMNTFVVDSIEEVNKIAKISKDVSILARLQVTDNASIWRLSQKFGAQKHEVVDIAKYCINRGTNFKGIAFHVGSQSMKSIQWIQALQDVSEVMKELLRSNIKIETLDIGGGFPVEYANFKDFDTLDDIAGAIKKGLSLMPYMPRVLVEPGRYIVATAGSLYTSVILSSSRNDRRVVYLDTGVFNALKEAIEGLGGLNYPVSVFGNLDNRSKSDYNYIVAGPTCDSQDIIMKELNTNFEILEGDLLIIENVGAYSWVYGSTFNGFAVPERFYI